MSEATIITQEPQVQSYHELRIKKEVEIRLRFRQEIGGSFERFCRYVAPSNPRYPDYLSFRHIGQMLNVLDRVAKGELTHVMFFLPSQYFKSTIVSRLFSAYYLFCYPDRWVGLASYSGDTAHMMSRSALNNFVRSGMRLHPDVQATKEWMTSENGGMWSAGVGGSITGRSGDLGIVDDPFKDEKEAYSRHIRESRIDWYRSVWSDRNFRQQVIVETRWHEEDLAGYLLSEEIHNPKRWHIFVFDAVKEEHPFPVPVSCILEPDWRVPGEALCPEIHSSEELVVKRKDSSELFWNAKWQQRPVVKRGNKWQADWFMQNVFDALPEDVVNMGYDWDTAQTDDESNAANAFVKACVKDKVMYVTDLGFEWFEFPQLISWMRTKDDAPHYVEAKSSGKDVVSTLKSEDVAAFGVEVRGDKESRTDLVLHYAEKGQIKIARHLVDKLLNDGKQGILAFPRGRWRDLNDALVQAINRLLKQEHELVFVGA